jgi:hypothetical protein
MIPIAFVGLVLLVYGFYGLSKKELTLFNRKIIDKSALGCSAFLIILGFLAMLLATLPY